MLVNALSRLPSTNQQLFLTISQAARVIHEKIYTKFIRKLAHEIKKIFCLNTQEAEAEKIVRHDTSKLTVRRPEKI